jgi:hypothetical protein
LIRMEDNAEPSSLYSLANIRVIRVIKSWNGLDMMIRQRKQNMDTRCLEVLDMNQYRILNFDVSYFKVY